MVGPIVINGDVWRPQMVDPGDPRLRDRTGSTRIATTDPSTRCVYLSRDLREPFLDRVLLHEAGHCPGRWHSRREGRNRAGPVYH